MAQNCRRSADGPAGAAPAVALDADGRLEAFSLTPGGARLHVFAVTVAGALRTRVQDRPSGGWQPWTAFGDRAIAPLVSGSPAL